MLTLNIIVFGAHIQKPISQMEDSPLPVITAIFGALMCISGVFCLTLYVLCAYIDPEDRLVVMQQELKK